MLSFVLVIPPPFIQSLTGKYLTTAEIGVSIDHAAFSSFCVSSIPVILCVAVARLKLRLWCTNGVDFQ